MESADTPHDDEEPKAEAPPAEQAAPEISENLRVLLQELEAYLENLEPDQLSEHVLPLISSWVLKDAGFDVKRFAQLAREFVDATPESDRVLRSFPDAVAYYMALRLTLDADDEPDPEPAQRRLDAARAAVENRARLVEAEFPRVAEGFRRLLGETADTKPPEDRLWRALALRIGEREMPPPGRGWRS